jgi:hypothetical protein
MKQRYAVYEGNSKLVTAPTLEDAAKFLALCREQDPKASKGKYTIKPV